ncbi:hypothetical protein Pdw03_6290 [Penicillium digitatum]|uniref:Uncharacterized protein n=3 Tax=Penicillium digitatum TaxID=36651 RepID=K9GA74_PEND2|nr:hypothetical protein PDIP_38110 [Penicillium digitatum Pd1]EKV16077.1 hypothetical protein PDIP_38110 [Penicillium digitatum Pd1]EKV18017.1 hypothetical protein PDIG_11880 [Penicillium digitatum PHI26]QQK42389.1 hypothetical protein Pdw03_6290 [Penicillium digitatum]
MCNPLASPRSDVTVTAVPVPVPAKSTNPKVGLPSTSVADSSAESLDLSGPSHDKRNAFSQRLTKVTVRPPSHAPRSFLRSSFRSSFRSSSIPPVPPIPASILKNRPGNITISELKPRSSSAPPSPPKMTDSPNVPEGNNKPLPVSPSSRYGPHTPSPRKSIFRNDGIYHPSVSPMDRATGASSTGVSPSAHRSSLTLKDLPEAVRSIQYKYETDFKQLAKKIDNIEKVEQKVEDFVTMTRDYIQDQMDAQLQRQSDGAFELTKAKLDATEAKEQVEEIKEQIHEMRLEINGLTSSFNDLSAKVDMCLTGIYDNTEEPFVAYQRRKNTEIDEDIQDIGDTTVEQAAQILFLRQMLIRIQVALRVLQHEHGLNVSDEVEKILPPTPFPIRDTVPPTGTLRTVSSQSAAIPPTQAATPVTTPVPAKSPASATTTVPAKTTLSASATPPASASGSATITPPGSSTVKPSSIPRRSKKMSLRKSSNVSSGSTVAQETSVTEEETVPPVPALPHGIRVPFDAARDVPIPLANIHPLFRAQFNGRNAEGIPAAAVLRTGEPSGPVSQVETREDEARK